MENLSSIDRSFSRISALASLLLILGGASACATKDAAWVHENLTKTENFHASTSVLETPAFPNTGDHEARLRATARARGKRVGAEIELAIRAEFADYSFLDRVSFAGANNRAFPLTVEKREPINCGTTDQSLCNVYEYVSVKLSRDFLKTKNTTGFHVKLWGRRDSVVIEVPAEYIEGLLARMENRQPMTIPSAATTGAVPAAPAP